MASIVLAHKEREKSSLVLIVSVRSVVVRRNIGESVMVKDWNSKRQRVKANDEDAEITNGRIARWEKAAQDTVSFFAGSGVTPTSGSVKERLEFFFNGGKEVKGKTTLKDYMSTFIERYTGVLSKGRIKTYRLAENILGRFQGDTRRIYYIDKVDAAFYEALKKWFFSNGYSQNYFACIVKIYKKALRDAGKVDKFDVGDDFKDFSARETRTDNIYLTEDELLAIYGLELKGNLAKCRDLFIIGAYTGLRFSDYSRLQESNISGEDYISILTQKTRQKVVIPIHWVVREILERGYDFGFTISDQKLNKNIKVIAEKAGLTGTVLYTENKGGKTVEMSARKCDLVCTHTARRSFATNAYKAGIDSIAIMKITGHKSEADFLRYIKVTEEENAERLSHHEFFRKDTKK